MCELLKFLLYNLRHIGYLHVLSLSLISAKNYTRRYSDLALTYPRKKKYLLYKANIRSYKKTTMFWCHLLLQGKSCWLYFEDRKVKVK
jgi:hypothetical protein